MIGKLAMICLFWEVLTIIIESDMSIVHVHCTLGYQKDKAIQHNPAQILRELMSDILYDSKDNYQS